MMMKTVLGILAALAVPASAWGQTEGSVAITTPDQRGHLLKMTEELLRSAKTRDPNAKAELFLRLGEERAKELERMQQQGKNVHHDALGRSYEKLLTKGAAATIETGAARGVVMTPALGRYAEATARHRAVLERVLAKAPPQAQKGLLHALEASRHGHEQAIQAHERGKGKFERQGAPATPNRSRTEGETPERGKGPDDRPGKGKPEGADPGSGGPPPGKDKGPGGPPPGKGKPEGSGPDSGKDKGPGGPPPEKRKPDGPEPGKEKGPGGPPPGKGKDEKPPGPPPGKGKGGGS